ncbi:hypothetical protein Val02_81560 [Virgisporangium aliadipatigenens]|uniref:NodB homology domain-containing protein n=1 Tax=Virgisporangium aliadipatigenens TaxID=741659 RepID=A0A8J3YWT0_9ACTN|nr:glycosyltransferase [Virgisporangium aliadipatigenens]GIJ51270.1 hypothetical protein Val02_81560 [Virgisporangium aliadipatigenens]
MARHQRAPRPRAHWSVLALATVALFATLALDGFARNAGGGTAPPGRFGTQSAPGYAGPVVLPDGGARRLPDGTVALTFDDGPDPLWTPRVLDTLKRHGVKATFFVVGTKVNAHPELVRRIAAEGHALGLHSFSHHDLGGLSPQRRAMEFNLTSRAVARATGQDVRLFRPPYAGTPTATDPAPVEEARRRGYVTVLADLDTKDWSRPGAAAIAGAAAPVGPGGAVVLMHDGGGDRSQTVAALDVLLPALAARGVRTVTVPDGLSDVDVGPVPAQRRERAQGWAFALAQRVSSWVAGVLFVLLIVASVLALARIGIQGYSARRHARRRRREPPGFGTPPVSVVVPAHNEAANIAATVRSLVDNAYPGLEVVVVDDGSTDDTAGIVERLDLPGVRLLRRPNGGKSDALRAGVAAASHDVLVLVDGDTIVEPNTIALLVRSFDDPTVGAVAGNAKVANRGGVLGRWQHLEYVVAFNLDRRVYETVGCMPTVPGALGAFRRAALEQAGGLSSDTLAEDTDLTMAVCRAGWRVVYDDAACAWTEAPGTWRGLWRQRYRWCFGTMQAMWKHRASVREDGAGGRLGRRAIPYIVLFQIVQPLLAPIVDVYMLYSLCFQPLSWTTAIWLVLHAAQLAVSVYAFRLDKEPTGPLWTLPLQQVVYRQLIYLVVLQSAVTALVGARLGWQTAPRTGKAAAVQPRQSIVILMRRGEYRDPRWARLLVACGTVLALISAAALVGGRYLLQRYEDSVRRADLLGPTAVYDRDGPLNILLMGVDWRRGQSGFIRADTVLVLHVPRERDRAYLFSLPRDTIVDIPAEPATGFVGGRDRLNAAFAYGAGEAQDRARGGRLLARAAAKMTGLPGFSAAALVDFYGFTEIVAALGGVDMCVDAETHSTASGVVYPVGCQRMNGTSALDYVRQRKSLATGDYARQRHQQQLIKAIAREARRQNLAGDPTRLDRIVRAAGAALTVTTGPVSPTQFLFGLHRIPPEKIILVRTAGHSIPHPPGTPYLGEELEPEAFDLFAAVRDGRLDDFVATHPHLVNQEG